MGEGDTVLSKIQILIEEYQDVFQVPQGLPS